MHRYQPRFHVVLHKDKQQNTFHKQYSSNFFQNKCNSATRHTFIFPETSFIAVTAYQNHQVSFNLFY